ncbi:MAG: formate C-acetyltransferase [Betaproteobacteria bacterium]|nr:formate C-acetyltransferase [Betaproteobacteria bacterium]
MDIQIPQQIFNTATHDPWRGFKGDIWKRDIAVRDFIHDNYTEYRGDAGFLAGPTEKTLRQWAVVVALLKQERLNDGVLEVSTEVGSSITSHAPGYISRADEVIVGLQTDAPLRRAIFPKGGLRMVEQSLEEYGFPPVPNKIKEIFQDYRKSHNEGVFDVYDPEILACRRSGVITGLPDAYGRGRIIGDYRRIALYGVDALIEERKRQKAKTDGAEFTEMVIRQREELSEQIKALNELKIMALGYGFDLSKPASTALEAVQWLYFGYLAAAKEANGAATSVGRVTTFLDIYIQRDLNEGHITEAEAQEMIDHLVIKFRIIRYMRTKDFDALYSGDPTWVTLSLAGMSTDGASLVSKTCFRILQTLYNIGLSPEPNLTILWSVGLPEGFKAFASKVAIDTSAVQFENDDVMRPQRVGGVSLGDDYAIACCVSAMRVGKQMQFFGARANLAKALLYAINGGVDEMSGMKVAEGFEPITGEILDYGEVMARFEKVQDWLASVYVRALNTIHYMHDKYAPERLMMALHDRDILRTMAMGIAGLSITADSLSAIKHARVRPIRNEAGVAIDFAIEGNYPAYGNNDDSVDSIAVALTEGFMERLRRHRFYRDAVPTQSVLTITSNVVYGKKTGTTPCGRLAGKPFSPGANPTNGRDQNGWIAAGFSVAKIPYDAAQDGISWTASSTPGSLGKTPEERIVNMANCLDGFCDATGFHINVNVLNRETLLEAMRRPEEYPQLTIRVSGYAVNFIRLTREQQLDVISRTFHETC